MGANYREVKARAGTKKVQGGLARVDGDDCKFLRGTKLGSYCAEQHYYSVGAHALPHQLHEGQVLEVPAVSSQRIHPHYQSFQKSCCISGISCNQNLYVFLWNKKNNKLHGVIATISFWFYCSVNRIRHFNGEKYLLHIMNSDNVRAPHHCSTTAGQRPQHSPFVL